MKKFFLLITVVVMSMAMTSCDKDDAEPQPQTGIVGKWKRQTELPKNGHIEYSTNLSYWTFKEDGTCICERVDYPITEYDKYVIEEWDTVQHPRGHYSRNIKDYPLFLSLYLHSTLSSSYHVKVADNDTMFWFPYIEPGVIAFSSPLNYRLVRCR